MSRLPTTPKGLPYKAVLRSTTLRGFTGGWNVLDDDMNLAYRFATQMENCFPTNDGAVHVRAGTDLFAACASKLSSPASLINMEYFNASLIAVFSNGEVLRILADGSTVRIFDTAIAASLPDAPSAWGTTDFVSFAQFNGHLILCNGSDKPLDIDSEFVVEYLQDAATNTNINVPICRYVVALSRYLIMAGDPLELDRVHISARDAPGTWYGDPPPNDATRIDVGSVLGTTTIRGLMPFRGKLVVMFAEGLVFGTLGATDGDGNHTPDFDDGVLGYGSISHRAGISYGDDAFFMDLEGVPSIKRTVFSTSFKPDRISKLVDPEIRAQVTTRSFGALEDHVFAVHDKRNAQMLLFVPNGDTTDTTTETKVFVYSRLADNEEAWSLFTGWNFVCGVRSLQGEVFFGDAQGNIWHYTGNTDFADRTATPVAVGVGIDYVWELPWLDFGTRTTTKRSRYIGFDTRGKSEFTVSMYVDNFTDPSLTTQFSGGEQGEYGSGDQPYGGGRNTSRKKLYAWTADFQIARLKFSGTSNEALAFVSISIHYHQGNISR